MNNCVLMAEIIQDPQLRYTSDTQTPIAEMLVQFPGLREDDPPSTLKVVGWGNLAQEIQENYHQGDRVVLEGRLNMNTVERPEGFREKRAEMTAQRIYRLGADTQLGIDAATASSPAKSSTSPAPAKAARSAPPSRPAVSEPAGEPAYSKATADSPDYDDIPF